MMSKRNEIARKRALMEEIRNNKNSVKEEKKVSKKECQHEDCSGENCERKEKKKINKKKIVAKEK